MRIAFIHLGLLLSVALFLTFSIQFACGDDDDDSNEGDDESTGSGDDDDDQICVDYDDDTGGSEDDNSCYENAPNDPVVLEYYALVNGERREFPITIKATDSFSLALEYEDADCNLGYPGFLGMTSWDVDGEFPLAFDKMWFFPEDMPCSSEQAGQPWIHEFDPQDFIPSEPVKGYFMGIFDACSMSTPDNPIYFNVTVEE